MNRDELILTIIFSILASCLFSIFIKIFTVKIQNKVVQAISLFVISSVLGCGLIILMNKDKQQTRQEDIWNNGYCICGGEWKLIDIDSTISDSKTYYYQCTYCDGLFETKYKFE